MIYTAAGAKFTGVRARARPTSILEDAAPIAVHTHARGCPSHPRPQPIGRARDLRPAGATPPTAAPISASPLPEHVHARILQAACARGILDRSGSKKWLENGLLGFLRLTAVMVLGFGEVLGWESLDC